MWDPNLRRASASGLAKYRTWRRRARISGQKILPETDRSMDRLRPGRPRAHSGREAKPDPGLQRISTKRWRAFAKEVWTMATQTETQRRLERFEKDGCRARPGVALRDELEQSLKVSWGEVYKAALGSALTVSQKPEETARAYPPRNFPLVYLDNHPKTNAAIEQYLRAWQAGQLTPTCINGCAMRLPAIPITHRILNFLPGLCSGGHELLAN